MNETDTGPALILVDGNNYVYRAFYAIQELSNSKGFPTNAIYGFTNMLMKLLREQKPAYIAVAFDMKGPTFRHEAFEAYKATRKPMPEPLRPQMDYIKNIVRGFSIPVLEREGIEADDIIGTLARRFAGEGLRVVLVSGDKDLMQLVGDHVIMIDTMKDAVYDVEAVRKRFGVDPDKVVEILGLTGDASDNIPGVPGIGPKGALRLIEQFGTIEAALSNPGKIYNARMRGALTQYAEQARMSRDLATINTQVELDLTLETLRYGEPDRRALLELFKECEFSSLVQEMKGEEATLRGHYRLVQKEADLDALMEEIRRKKSLTLDFVLTLSEPMRADIAGVAVCAEPGEAFYIPLIGEDTATGNVCPKTARETIAPLLADPAVRKNGHDFKSALIALDRMGLSLGGIQCDTMVAAYLLNPARRSFDLPDVVFEQIGWHIQTLKDLLGSGTKTATFRETAPEKIGEYACRRADAVTGLTPVLLERIEAEGFESLLQDLEMPLVSVLAAMERHGVLIDAELLHTMSAELAKILALSETKIYQLAGERFNINSPKQLQAILYDKLQLPRGKKIKEGYSTDGETLAFLARSHELPGEILAYRSLVKLKSTYIDALPLLIHPETGRIHTSYNQTVTATGRLSSSNPNLQNIPVRTLEGKRIRQAFIAPEGCEIVSADYSQIELRILAHLSGDRNLVDAFLSGEDIHSRTASDIFGVFPAMVNADMRRQAKVINFGVLYGMSAFGLSRELGLSPKMAQTYIDGYFEKYSGVRTFLDGILEGARAKGYVTTLLNRRRFVPEINSPGISSRQFAERTAINTPIQGTAADLIKVAMLNIHNLIRKRKMKSAMIMQVHDELVFEVPVREKEELMALVKTEMEEVMKLDVPLKVEISSGRNWDEAH
ncbi:MAG: DNA polymerase I [Syntrophales bacterium]|jgi:DNA polymerase-1|nr:DNA polymerase I [Syntrophales bacterium]